MESEPTSSPDSVTPDIAVMETASDTVTIDVSNATAGETTEEPDTTVAAESSTAVTIDSIENVQIVNLRAEFLRGKRVLVSWRLSSTNRPTSLTGFRIFYK
ncbi:hypothetical protein EGW08_023249, partial [Elysia chlorotica]